MVKRGARTSSSEQTGERSSRAPASAANLGPSRPGREPPPLAPPRPPRTEPLELSDEARALSRDDHEAGLLEEFFSWPPSPPPEMAPEPFVRAPMSRGSRRAMWASIVMLFGAVLLRGGFEAYQRLVMPPPAELGDWSDDDTLALPTPLLAEDIVQAEAQAPRRYTASLQHDLSAIQQVEPTQAGEVRAEETEDEPADTGSFQHAAEPEAKGAAEPAAAAEPQLDPAAELAAGEPTANAAGSERAEPAANDQTGASFEAQLALARQLLAQGQPRRSLPMFERAIELRAHAVDALLGKASALFALQDYEAAKSSAQQAIAINPRSHEGMTLIGLSFERLGDREAAKSIYERCVEQATDLTSCRERLAQLDAKP